MTILNKLHKGLLRETKAGDYQRQVSDEVMHVRFDRKIAYDLFRGQDLFNKDNDLLLYGGKLYGGKRFVVVDEYVYHKNKEKLHEYFISRDILADFFVFNSGEEEKNLENYIRIFRRLNNFQIDRRGEPIIAIGGGVLTDVVGFVAGTFRRGVPHVKVPTTLMGYVDASVGIKTGINFDGAKNRMGTFEPPIAVILDSKFLKTLSRRHIVNGLGEILKIAVIKDIQLLELLEKDGETALFSNFQDKSQEILDRSIMMMIEELAPNLYEDNLERSVDFGHTFSPAMEMIPGIGLLHGEAVAIDVALSLLIAQRRGLLSSWEVDRVFKIIKKLDIPCYAPLLSLDVLWDGVQERALHRDGRQRIPLPNSLGKCCFIHDMDENELRINLNLLKDRSDRC